MHALKQKTFLAKFTWMEMKYDIDWYPKKTQAEETNYLLS